MTTAYQPPTNLRAKIERKLLPFQARRNLPVNLTRPIVSFTFDDFPRSALKNGARVLEARNWRASFYVACGLAGTTNHHGKNFAAKDVRELFENGHEIAGHTYSHVDCTTLSMDAVALEISRNRDALKKIGIKAAPEHFAYPYGSASPQLKRFLSGRFKSMRGIAPGVHHKTADLNGLKSTPLFSGERVAQALALIESLKRKPGWLTLFAHDIRPSPSPWGCTPHEFLSVVRAVENTGAQVMPIGEALAHLEAVRE